MFSVIDVKDDEGMSPLDIALEDVYVYVYARYEVPLYLVRCGCGSAEDKAKLLRVACKHGELDVVKELVEQYKVDPNGEISLNVATIRAENFMGHKMSLFSRYYPIEWVGE